MYVENETRVLTYLEDSESIPLQITVQDHQGDEFPFRIQVGDEQYDRWHSAADLRAIIKTCQRALKERKRLLAI